MQPAPLSPHPDPLPQQSAWLERYCPPLAEERTTGRGLHLSDWFLHSRAQRVHNALGFSNGERDQRTESREECERSWCIWPKNVNQITAELNWCCFSSASRLMQHPPATSTSPSLLLNLWGKELLSQEPGPPSGLPPPSRLLPPPRGQSSSQWAARHCETLWSWLKMAWPSPSVVTLLQAPTKVTQPHTNCLIKHLFTSRDVGTYQIMETKNLVMLLYNILLWF